MTEMPNDTERFLQWLRAGAPEGTLAEIRVKPVQFKGRTPAVRVGFFDQPAVGARASWWWGEGRAQVYAGLHPRRADVTDTPNPHQLAKAVPPARAGNAEDVVAMCHVLLDFDPVRGEGAKGQPSSEEELERAHQVALACDAWLREQGFHTPLANLSGNGYHLLMTVPPQDPATFAPRLRAFLHEMAKRFGTAEVEVDTSVYDPPRICKVPGTISVKGDNSSAERPWRRAKILRWSEPVADEKLAEHILSLPPIVEVRAESADGQARETICLGDAKRRPRVELDYALGRCAFLQHCKNDAKSLPEPEWHAMLSNVLTCEGGEGVAHELSRPYVGYSEQETDMKIRHVLRSAPGPHACTTIAGLGWTCPYLDTCPARAPASLAIRDAPRSTDSLDMDDEAKIATLQGVADEIREILSDTAPSDDDTARAQRVARVTRSLVGEAGWSLWMALDAIEFSRHGSDRPRAVIRAWAVEGLKNEARSVQVPATPDVAGAEALLSDLPGAYIARLLEGDEAERIGVLIDLAQAGAPEATVLGASLLGDGGADDFRTAMAILNGGVSR